MGEADGMWVQVRTEPGPYGIEMLEPLTGALLGTLGMGVKFGDEVGKSGIVCWMNEERDARLEEAIAVLAELRWRYDPGRTLQMVLPGMVEAPDCGPAGASEEVEDGG